jgi:plasmid stabilization system protein ParE
VKPARFDGAAQAEVDQALAWYAERDPDLPARLLSEIRDTVERLRQFPPLRIVAFAHAKRRPLYWISRISE